MKEKKVMKLASRGKRFAAFCIDAAVPVIAATIFVVAAIAAAISSFMFSPGFGYGFGAPDFGYGYGYDRGLSAGTVTALIISIILSVAYLAVQLVFFNSSRTLGKAALGLQVISSTDGEPVGFWKMLFREWFVKQASGAVFLLGYIWVLIDERNRGWHDKILDTYVVDLKETAAINRRTGPVQTTRAPSVRAAGGSPHDSVYAVTVEEENIQSPVKTAGSDAGTAEVIPAYNGAFEKTVITEDEKQQSNS